jgi:uncharacterized membrane protein
MSTNNDEKEDKNDATNGDDTLNLFDQEEISLLEIRIIVSSNHNNNQIPRISTDDDRTINDHEDGSNNNNNNSNKSNQINYITTTENTTVTTTKMISSRTVLYHYIYVNMVVPMIDGVSIVVYGMVVLRYYIISIMNIIGTIK